MEMEQEKSSTLSRRNFMTKAGIFLAGGITGCASRQLLPEDRSKNEPPPLPWPWAKLDPMEAGLRAYRGYLNKKPGG